MTLREILELPKQPPKQSRLSLCYHLSKAFWNFYGSGWSTTPWTRDNVRFMFDNDELTTGILLSDPYLEVSGLVLTTSDLESRFKGQENGATYCSHRLPKVLALGVMLIEIEIGRKIENIIEGPKGYDKNVHPSINTLHATALRIYLSHRNLWEEGEGVFGKLQEVIATCLGLSKNVEDGPDVPLPLEKPFLEIRDNNPEDLPKLRHAIDEHIVKPIETLYFNSLSSKDRADPQKLDCRTFHLEDSEKTVLASQEAIPPGGETHARFVAFLSTQSKPVS